MFQLLTSLGNDFHSMVIDFVQARDVDVNQTRVPKEETMHRASINFAALERKILQIPASVRYPFSIASPFVA